MVYSDYDRRAAAILDDFLPEKLFDAHMHIYRGAFMQQMFRGREPADLLPEEYFHDMQPLLGNRDIRLNMIVWPDSCMADPATGALAMSDAFLLQQLERQPGSVGEIVVCPSETVDQLENRLTHPRICGFKCYHFLSGLSNSWQAEISEYLPESAWQAAERHGLCITLHMVRDHALADPANLSYIRTMAARYPNATLILAHAARSFASWTGVEAVEQVADLENVWFDLSAVCESPAIFQILNQTGTERCMWGSDYNVSVMRGKAISLGDSFYWIYEQDLDRFVSATKLSSGLIGTENLMAVRQACIMAGLGHREVEKIFCGNAAALFQKEKN